jgi:hypothetical protein
MSNTTLLTDFISKNFEVLEQILENSKFSSVEEMVQKQPIYNYFEDVDIDTLFNEEYNSNSYVGGVNFILKKDEDGNVKIISLKDDMVIEKRWIHQLGYNNITISEFLKHIQSL